MACQSLARPSSAEYWHIGAMTMRLDRVRGPNEIGENNWLKTVMDDEGVRIAPPHGLRINRLDGSLFRAAC